MDRIAIVALTVIVSFVWFANLEGEVRKDYVAAGYIVIDRKAYRLIPATLDIPSQITPNQSGS